ncbi:MAG: mandelate racemase/muconate lactonizing enzyme family protein [Candidatus Cyclobacteriaceae bacterium M3_2C_046]
MQRRSFFKRSILPLIGFSSFPLNGFGQIPKKGGFQEKLAGPLKISQIEVIDCSLKPGEKSWSPVFVKVYTDQGIHGTGEMAPAYSSGIIPAMRYLQVAGKNLIGKDPFKVSQIVDGLLFQMKRPSLESAHVASALDMALMDIKGKALGVPVYDLIGGKRHDHVRVYANGWCYNMTEPAQYAEAALKNVENGFTAMKLDPFRYYEGGFDWANQQPDSATRTKWVKVGLDRVKAIRQAVGTDVDIFLEAHGKFDPSTALYIAQAFEEIGLYAYEEPIDSTNIDYFKKVSEGTTIPLASGERLISRQEFRPFIEQQLVSIIQPDLGMAGGILETRKIADHAEIYKIYLAPHNSGGPVCTAASVQTDAACANFIIQETFPYRPPEYFDFAEESYESHIINGYIKVPDKPGLGIELDDDKIKNAPRIIIN